MVKLVFCLRRQAELSREEFQRYWFDNHAPLVRKNAEALGIRRYVQVHTRDSEVAMGAQAARGAPEPFDGVAELWFDSAEAMAANDHPGARAAGQELLEDERRFIDLANSPIWLAEEKEVIGG